jgi:hypothetical protein
VPNPLTTLCRYTTDREGRLAFVDRGWCEFATANAAPPDYAIPERLYGRALLSFISDSTTLHVYSLLMERVLREKVPIVVPFRCDSPPERRWLELEMTPHEDGIHFASRQVSVEPRPVPVPFDRPGTRADLLLRMCSWCKDVELAAGSWGPVEEAVKTFALFRDADVPGITHGICPSCVKVLEDPRR